MSENLLTLATLLCSEISLTSFALTKLSLNLNCSILDHLRITINPEGSNKDSYKIIKWWFYQLNKLDLEIIFCYLSNPVKRHNNKGFFNFRNKFRNTRAYSKSSLLMLKPVDTKKYEARMIRPNYFQTWKCTLLLCCKKCLLLSSSTTTVKLGYNERERDYN